MPLSSSEKQQLLNQVREEYKAGLDFRRQREAAWQLAEDQYFNKVTKSLKQRYNVPVPIVPGFVETLLSKVDDPPTLKFDPREEADYKASKKVTALYQAHKDRDDHDWEMLDLDGKKQAVLYGRAIYKYFAQSQPSYSSNLEVVDVYDFYCDPIGGGNLEKHRFLGQDNIFRSRTDLKDGVENGIYDARMVEKVINATSADKHVDNDNLYKSKQARMMALGMDGITYNYAGQDLYKFLEHGTIFKGQRYYVLFNYEMNIAIRCVPLEEVFKKGLWWFVSWATHRDIFNFWNKAPVDDIVPLAEMIKTLANQELDNRQKRNFGQRAYDPKVFPEPDKLGWRPDGLVPIKSGSSEVKPINNAIYEFETPELTGTINLVNWIDGILGQKTGVTADSQGASQEDKVGIYYGNMQQVADRLGLYNKSYKKAWSAIGRRWLHGVFEHLKTAEAVKIIGESAVEWTEISKREIDTDWNIRVEGGNAQLAADELKKKNRREALLTLAPDELPITSPKWRAKEKLRAGDYDEDDLIMAFDVQGDGSRELMSEASQAIQDIIAGKMVKLNRGANTAFIQKIMDYALDNTDGDLPLFERLMAYVEAHKQIVAETMMRKAVMAAPGMVADMAPPPGSPPGLTAPPPNTAPGTASRSLSDSSQLTPNYART